MYYPLNDYTQAHIAVDSLLLFLLTLDVTAVRYSPSYPGKWHTYVEAYAVVAEPTVSWV